MNFKKYLKLEIKQTLPYFIIFLILFGFSSILGMSTLNTYYKEGSYLFNTYSSGLYTLIGIPVVFASIYPFTIFTYRYKTSSTDFYYQVAMDKRNIKRTKYLVGLVYLAVGFILFYSFGVLVLYLNTLDIPKDDPSVIVIPFKFGMYFLALFPLLICLMLIYSFSSFLVSLSNNFKDSILHYLFGSSIFNLVIAAPALYIATITNSIDNDIGKTLINPLNVGFSPNTALSMFESIFNNLIISKEVDNLNSVQIVFTILSIFVSIACVLCIILLKERSGEASSRHGGYNLFTKALPHICFALAGLYAASLFHGGIKTFTIVAIMVYVFMIVTYYLALVLYYKSWKLNKCDLISFISISGSLLVLSIISGVVKSV